MDATGSAPNQPLSSSVLLKRKGQGTPVKLSKVELRLPPPNTYRLKPKITFQQKPVLQILEEKTNPLFEKIYDYDFDDFAVLCKYLSIELLRAVNGLYWPSYKIVIAVQCVERADNSFRGTVRYYWNPKFDGLVVHKYEADNYIISVTAAFFYYE